MEKTGKCLNDNLFTVGVGRKIEIEVNGERQRWEVVGFGKTDIQNEKISYQSPLIQKILGAKRGDKIHCKIMNRDIAITIKNIST